MNAFVWKFIYWNREKSALEMEKNLHSLWSCSDYDWKKNFKKTLEQLERLPQEDAPFLDFGAMCNDKIEKNEASKI